MSLDGLKSVIAKHWGFSTLRPLQEQAMNAVLAGRDSLLVLPTGGGKSLCYQAPAVYRNETTVVVSPLISLMKDQVDALQACGISAIQIDSSQTAEERFSYELDIRQGAVRLVFVSPERLVTPNFHSLLRSIQVRAFAIDEAHCISHWGHDFRPEYRQLNRLKELFPQASVHGYTATATEQVRQDIIEQLGLRSPAVLVGNFDRPNLAYRVLPRTDLMKQVMEVLDRHKGEAGIIYCIRRKDVDELTAALRLQGCKAEAYHAGLTPEQRQRAQDAFIQEQCDLVVATVAFGMGIDRSNIRFVLHTGMPKSIEHYQQETGRAGRDGLEAECILLHSGGDFMTWKFIMEKSAAEEGVDPAFLPNAIKHLNDMARYATGAVCRHKSLVEYFGQSYSAPSCQACDMCLGDAEVVADSVTVAQKILSCVARVKENYGIGHVSAVLRGQRDERILRLQHDKLSTYGLLSMHPQTDIRNWIQQLIGQGVLQQVGDEYPVLKLNPASWEVMKNQRSVRLLQPTKRKKGERPEKSKADTTSWEGVDRDLFEALRELRRELAEARAVPPYVIFSDATLRELARIRPSSLPAMRLVYGVGDAKLRDFGPQFFQEIADHCRQRGLSMDNSASPKAPEKARSTTPKAITERSQAYGLFRQGASIDTVVEKTAWGRAKVVAYLSDFIGDERPASIATWVSKDVYQRVFAAARQHGVERLKPIYIALGEKISYDEIRLVVTHLTAGQTNQSPSP